MEGGIFVNNFFFKLLKLLSTTAHQSKLSTLKAKRVKERLEIMVWFTLFFETKPRVTKKGVSILEIVVLPLLSGLDLQLGVLVEHVLDSEVINGLGGLHGVQLTLELVQLLLNV